MFEFFCLMVHGPGLTSDIRRFLLKASQEMFRKRKQRQDIKTDEFEGWVETDFKHAALGWFSGIVFSAEIESDKGRTWTRYIVNTRNLEEIDIDQEVIDITYKPEFAQNAPWN